jgi:hypothetical protein
MTFKHFIDKCGPVRHRPKIVCKDGFKISVQGSEMAYSIPRKTGIYFDAMEIGFPSQKEELIMEYMEVFQPDTDPTETVYPYVPFAVISEVIEKHGGIDEEKTFEDF